MKLSGKRAAPAAGARAAIADAAREAGHEILANRLSELWTSVYAHRGYDRYNAMQAQRARWVVLRNRLNYPAARDEFAQADVDGYSPDELRTLDWLLVGGERSVCPDDVMSVVLGYWSA